MTDLAIAIRPQLTQLLGAQTGQQMADRLDLLMARSSAGEDVNREILTLLTDTKATQQWVTRRLSRTSKSPQEHSGQRLGRGSVPGQISAISAPEYKCPMCSYTWRRSRVGETPPPCKNHDIPLTPI